MAVFPSDDIALVPANHKFQILKLSDIMNKRAEFAGIPSCHFKDVIHL